MRVRLRIFSAGQGHVDEVFELGNRKRTPVSEPADSANAPEGSRLLKGRVEGCQRHPSPVMEGSQVDLKLGRAVTNDKFEDCFCRNSPIYARMEKVHEIWPLELSFVISSRPAGFQATV